MRIKYTCVCVCELRKAFLFIFYFCQQLTRGDIKVQIFRRFASERQFLYNIYIYSIECGAHVYTHTHTHAVYVGSLFFHNVTVPWAAWRGVPAKSAKLHCRLAWSPRVKEREEGTREKAAFPQEARRREGRMAKRKPRENDAPPRASPLFFLSCFYMKKERK